MRFLQSLLETNVDTSLAQRRLDRDLANRRSERHDERRTKGIEHRLVPLLDMLSKYIMKGRSPLLRKRIHEYLPEANQKSRTIDGGEWHIHRFDHLAYMLVYDLRNKEWSPLCDYVKAALSYANMPEAQWLQMLNRYGVSAYITDNSEPDYYAFRSGGTVTLCGPATKNQHLGVETMLWDKFVRCATQGCPIGSPDREGSARYTNVQARPQFQKKWTEVVKQLT